MESEDLINPNPRYDNPMIDTVSALKTSQTPVPLRILIDNDLFGAVIGPRKVTIMQISKETKTRIFIDGVQNGRNENLLETSLAIYGKPNNCSNVCHKILEIMRKRQKQLHGNRYVTLKILIPRYYMGRIIGKNYNIIRTIMYKTETNIILSDVYDRSTQDRKITVKGSIKSMCKAEVQISKMLRQSFINDPDSMAPQFTINPEPYIDNPINANYARDDFQISSQTFPPVQYLTRYSNYSNLFASPTIQPRTNINPEFRIMEPTNTNYSGNIFQNNIKQFLPVELVSFHSNVADPVLDTNVQTQIVINPALNTMGATYINDPVPVLPIRYNLMPPAHLPFMSYNTDPDAAVNRFNVMMTVQIFIPLFSIKALAGLVGNSNNFATPTHANMRNLGITVENPIDPQQLCQKITIFGIRRAQWKAQQKIFNIMWKEGYGPAPEEVILTVELCVSQETVDCLVNNDRSLIKEMEKEMGCIIRAPAYETNNCNILGGAFVHIIGGFVGTQLAQKRICSM